MNSVQRLLSSRARITLLAMLVLGLTVVAAGCGQEQAKPGSSSPSQQSQTESKELTVAGSTSVQPVAEMLAEEYQPQSRGVRINVQGGGSSAGIQAATSGMAQIGTSSRELTAEESSSLKAYPIAHDGIAIIVNPANPVRALTLQQLAQIYRGEITEWQAVGGKPGKINVVTREAGSGTRSAFEELVLNKQPIASSAIVQGSTGAVIQTVANDGNAISYASLASVDKSVQSLSIDGVAPTPETVKAKTYKISRPFLFVFRNEPSGLAKSWLDYVLGTEGQAVVREAGLIPVK